MKLADENICTFSTLFSQLVTQVRFPFEWTGIVGRHAGRQHSQAAACDSPEECWPFSPGRNNPPACSNTPPVAPGSSPASSMSLLAACKHRHIKSEIIPTLCIICHCLLPETTDKPNLKLFLPCTQHVMACCLKLQKNDIWNYSSPTCSTSPFAAWNNRHTKSEIIHPLHLICHHLLPETTGMPNLKLFLPCM